MIQLAKLWNESDLTTLKLVNITQLSSLPPINGLRVLHVEGCPHLTDASFAQFVRTSYKPRSNYHFRQSYKKFLLLGAKNWLVEFRNL